MVKKVILKYKEHPLHSYALAQAILFFAFALILWGFDGKWYEVCAYRIWGSLSYGAVIIFMVATLYSPIGVRIKHFEEEKPSSIIKGIGVALFWGVYTAVYSTVYINSWCSSLSTINDTTVYVISFILGLILFCVIGFVLLKPSLPLITTCVGRICKRHHQK